MEQHYRKPPNVAIQKDPVPPARQVWQQRPNDLLKQHQEHRDYLRRRAHSIGVDSLLVVDLVDLVARLEEAKRTQGQKGDEGSGIGAAAHLMNLELAIKGLLAQRWTDDGA